MTSVVQLTGFAFCGYRSIFDHRAIVAPLEKITLIAGQNNSGKSNILRVAEHLDQLRKNAPIGLLDVPRREPTAQFELAIRRGSRAEAITAISTYLGLQDNRRAVRLITKILASAAFDLQNDGSVWFRYAPEGPGVEAMGLGQHAGLMTDVFPEVDEFNRAHENSHADSLTNALQFLKKIERNLGLPPVCLVQASRRISPSLDGDEIERGQSLSGVGLIRRLAALQSPILENDQDRERFAAINEFLQTVLEDETARLEIPYGASELNVRRQGILLPLDNLGTGVTQVIILAAASTLETNTLICMEEPEVHLHPRLQRKLLRYLHDKTDNQYLIATHSAHLLDSEIASVFHATYTDNGTIVEYAGTPAQLSEVCHDLGYRPSDLLQTNCVIWVEGPSDRIYIAHWLKLANAQLREGIDYSIMFYGGRLLSHLTADDPEITEFINLRRLNRHLAVVIDSDKSKPQDKINPTKRRIRDEITVGDDPGLVWVTGGRTIENYVPAEALTEALDGTHRGKRFQANKDRWSNVMRPGDPDAKWSTDKVKAAHAVVRGWRSGLDYLDLHEKVVVLAEMIESANGRQPARAKRVAKSVPVIVESDPPDDVVG